MILAPVVVVKSISSVMERKDNIIHGKYKKSGFMIKAAFLMR